MNLLAAFFLGLAGSLHCAAMCGPLLIAVNMARGKQSNNGILHNVAYHGGRIATYGVLGAISGLIGAAIVFAGFQRWISIAAGSLILLALLTSFRMQWGGIPGKIVAAAKMKFGRLLRKQTLGAVTLLGGLNGLLPCGLVYVACTVAATAGSVGGGVATMLAFGLGTAPMLLTMTFAGKVFRWGNPLGLRRVVLICAATAGVLLIVRGLALGIPYLSPHYSGGQGPTCCHHAM